MKQWALTAAACLILSGCSQQWPATELDDAGLQEAEERLYPAFGVIHDLEYEPEEALAGIRDEVLEALREARRSDEDDAALSLVVVHNPDADAGCLAGGRLFISHGLATRLENTDEFRSVMALAATACGQASEIWADREQIGLPEDEEQGWLVRRYADYRLDSRAALYRQLVARGCGDGLDCRSRAEEWLGSMGSPAEAMDAVFHRIESEWPDAAVLERFGPARSEQEGAGEDSSWQSAIEPLVEIQPFMDGLRTTQQRLVEGNVSEAHSRIIRARRAAEHPRWLSNLTYMRMNLANRHPEYAARDLQRILDEQPDYPMEAYYRGMAELQMGRRGAGRDLLAESLEVLPRVSSHYYLGLTLARLRDPEGAKEHFRRASTAGAFHPDHSDIIARLEAMDET